MAVSAMVNDAGDILYVRLRDGVVAVTRAFGDDRLVDFDADGKVLGAELMCGEDGIELYGLPEHERIQAALIAAGHDRFLIRAV